MVKERLLLLLVEIRWYMCEDGEIVLKEISSFPAAELWSGLMMEV
ncbi:MAG: hypothetical protein ACLUG3_01555 [Bacilli bacterium]